MADDPGPVLDQLNLVVRDMDAAMAFYRHLGLTIDDDTTEWAQHHRTAHTAEGLDFDLDSIESAKKWNQGQRDDATGPVIGFRLSSSEAVDRTYDDITGAGYTGLQPPWDAFFGARYAIVQDPDGNPVGLMGPVDPATRRPPETPSG